MNLDFSLFEEIIHELSLNLSINSKGVIGFNKTKRLNDLLIKLVTPKMQNDIKKIIKLSKMALIYEKALELLNNKNNYYDFVDERLGQINVHVAIVEAIESLKINTTQIYKK